MIVEALATFGVLVAVLLFQGAMRRERRRVLPAVVASPGYYPDDDLVTYESVARELRPQVRHDVEWAVATEAPR